MLNSFSSLYRYANISQLICNFDGRMTSRSKQASAARHPQRSESGSTPPAPSLASLPVATTSESSSMATSSPLSSPKSPPKALLPTKRDLKDHFYPHAATSLHPSVPGTTLTYYLITPHLALLALVPTSVFETRRGLLEYNVVFFREGVREICEVEREARGTYSGPS